MCRLIAYLGEPILLADVLVKPSNSLINQSYHAQESVEPLNGDGFGLGWYDHSIDEMPGIFKSIRPAWNNLNLQHLSEKIRSTCFLAHVRAASQGNVTGNNCHPFSYKNLLFVHNGNISNFQKIKRYVRRDVSDDVYQWINGQTDSEHIFAMIIQKMIDANMTEFTCENLQEVMIDAVQHIFKIHKKYCPDVPSFLNIVLSDGNSIIAWRYVSDNGFKARTLYYTIGERFIFKDNAFHMMESDKENKSILIASEKLNVHDNEWVEVKQGESLFIDASMKLKFSSLNF